MPSPELIYNYTDHPSRVLPQDKCSTVSIPWQRFTHLNLSACNCFVWQMTFLSTTLLRAKLEWLEPPTDYLNIPTLSYRSEARYRPYKMRNNISLTCCYSEFILVVWLVLRVTICSDLRQGSGQRLDQMFPNCARYRRISEKETLTPSNKSNIFNLMTLLVCPLPMILFH